MNRKISRILKTNILLYSVCLVAFVLAAIPVSPLLAIGEAAAVVLIFLVSRRNSASAQKSVRQYMERFTGGMDSARASNMLYAPMGIAVFDFDSGNILWANESFMEISGRKEDLFDTPMEDVVPAFSTHWLVEGKQECGELVTWEHRQFHVCGSVNRADEIAGVKGSLATTYWVDVTELEQMRSTLEDTRPVAAILMVDNYEDLMKSCPESKRSAIQAAIDEKISAWAADSRGMLLKYDRDRTLFLFEEHSFPAYAEHRFDLLDQVREVVEEESGVAATLSIGVGRDADNFAALFKNASLALEMALSRGGDQAVVKDRNNFDFYGGRSKVTEKRTKVKSRVMANALGELMDEAERVYVMGHAYADMDSLGAAAGIVAVARKRGKSARIIMDLENNAVHPMVKKLQALPEYSGAFLSGTEAFLRVQPGTLLVVVDTNRPGSVESEQLLDACNRVAVIDHHRRGSSYIDKMALNYHEPYASSASELVTELLQYLLEPGDLLRSEAEALLAGLVLDTKNFTNRAGSRTFEAAAYLRRSGADMADVQRMFQSNLEDMVSRYDILRQAEVYREEIAVVALNEECDRVTAAKASDELLTIKGIQASFVLYPKDEGVYISARSLGEINVQVIVEDLGGGGNSTTAGGQLAYATAGEAKEKLLASIDAYFEN